MREGGIERLKSSEIELKEKVVAINRVAKVVKGGRRFGFSAIVVIGDGKGVVGHGLGKANEATDAITKGVEKAKKNLMRVPLMKNTLPHDLYGKFGGGYVYIKPAAPGTGLIAGGAMRAVLESVGVQDCLAKSKGSSNPHNVVKATFKALSNMRDAYTIAKQRGVSLHKVLTGQTDTSNPTPEINEKKSVEETHENTHEQVPTNTTKKTVTKEVAKETAKE